MYQFINLTEDTIVLNDGRTFAPSGTVAEASVIYGQFDSKDICCKRFSFVNFETKYANNAPTHNTAAMPPEMPGTFYIVSPLALAALKASGREDFISPAVDHPEVVRNEKGTIVSVPGFVFTEY